MRQALGLFFFTGKTIGQEARDFELRFKKF